MILLFLPQWEIAFFGLSLSNSENCCQAKKKYVFVSGAPARMILFFLTNQSEDFVFSNFPVNFNNAYQVELFILSKL